MRERAGVAGAICALTLLSFFQFPGHTYLQADSQIYMPILEHIWNPDVLGNDPIVTERHVAFTLYDELAVGLRKLTGLSFEQVLEGEQIIFRAAGILGFYLIASSTGLSAGLSLLVAAMVALGATIGGPSVLSFEYEPTPRAFAVPLIFLAVGCIAHGRYLGGALAGSAAFLLHAPATYSFWAVYAVVTLIAPVDRSRKLRGLAILGGAAFALWLSSRLQGGGAQTAMLLTRVEPEQETLQRMRASYNWVSMWWQQWVPHYVVLCAATAIAIFRLRKVIPASLFPYTIGLPLIGALSVPTSYLLLDKMKLALLPQFQPMRALLFITVMAALLAAVAACYAARQTHYAEAFLWLALVYWIPVNTKVTEIPSFPRIAVIVGLAMLALTGPRLESLGHRWAVPLAAVAAFFAIPMLGGVVNYPALHTADLTQLGRWARASTSKSAVFLFPDAKQDLQPGIFRAEALRTVYVDWKAGGQVNYFKEFGAQWISRWQDTMLQPFTSADCDRLAGLGIDYIVLKREHKMAELPPVFENTAYAAYAIRGRQ
jgi:hypothetical protein